MHKEGLTLIEFLVALIILGILLTVGIPSMQGLIRDSQLAATHNSLLANLRLARSEAVTQGQPAIVCNGKPADGCDSDNGWEDGWYVAIVPPGENSCRDSDGDARCDSHSGRIIQRKGAIPDQLSLDGNGSLLISRVRFQPSGFARGYAGTLSLCDTSDVGATGSGIVINVTGRMRRARPGDLNC